MILKNIEKIMKLKYIDLLFFKYRLIILMLLFKDFEKKFLNFFIVFFNKTINESDFTVHKYITINTKFNIYIRSL